MKGDVTRPSWYSRTKAWLFLFPLLVGWGPPGPCEVQAGLRSPHPNPGAPQMARACPLSAPPGTGPQISFPDRLPPLSQAQSPSPQQSWGKEATCTLNIPPALVCGCLFCHILFCDRIRAINMTRPVESALGDGSESQGCGPASNDPGARARPDPGSKAPDSRTLPTPRPRTGAQGCPVAERDKRIGGPEPLPARRPQLWGSRPLTLYTRQAGKTSCL